MPVNSRNEVVIAFDEVAGTICQALERGMYFQQGRKVVTRQWPTYGRMVQALRRVRTTSKPGGKVSASSILAVGRSGPSSRRFHMLSFHRQS